MKKRIISQLTTALLFTVLLAVLLTSIVKIRPWLNHFARERVSLVVHHDDASGQAGRLLDQVLIQQLQHFKYIKSFDQIFIADSHQEKLQQLSVDRCEVNQAEFKKFVQWQKANKKFDLFAVGQPYGWQFGSSNEKHLLSGRLEAAANGIAYYDAYAYCRAAGGRLPYSDEWVAIAGGETQRLYPWGNQFNAAAWPYLDPLLNASQRCGLHSESNTPEDISDMGNNVSEWAQNHNNPLVPTIHGGNAYNQPYEIYALNSLYRSAPPSYRSPYVGFRCVYIGQAPQSSPWNTAIDAIRLKDRTYQTGIPRGAYIPGLIARLPKTQIDQIELIIKNKNNDDSQSFFMMTREVSRADYATFLADPLVQLGFYADSQEPLEHSYQPNNWEEQLQNPDLPVTQIDWWSAHAFANWAGGYLPTAQEWVLAASSGGKFIYPWGQEFIAGKAITLESRLRQPSSSASVNGDKTENNIVAMGGNVSEWTQSIDVEHGGYTVIVKGGNYMLPGEQSARIDFENKVPANYRSPSIGFRVAFSNP